MTFDDCLEIVPEIFGHLHIHEKVCQERSGRSRLRIKSVTDRHFQTNGKELTFPVGAFDMATEVL